MENKEFLMKITRITEKYRELLNLEFEERWNIVMSNLQNTAEYEVVFGLLARQCSFVNMISYSPLAWNDVYIQLTMRCMVENYLNLAFILKNPEKRAKEFIKYGLGRETKIIEFAKQKENLNDIDKAFVEANTNWVNEQSFIFLNEIDFGGWKKSDKDFTDVRNTAIDAEEKNYYDVFYDVCSSAIHSTWNYLAKKNLEKCKNPLHKNHRVPKITEPTAEFDLFFHLTIFLNDSFEKIDKHYNLKLNNLSAFEFISTEFKKLK